MRVTHEIPAAWTELLGAALLYWLDLRDAGRARRSYRERLQRAVDAAQMQAENWPEGPRELFTAAFLTIYEDPVDCPIDQTCIVDATESDAWAAPVHFGWQDRADIGDAR